MSDREVKRNASQLHFGIITNTAPHFACIHLILRNASVVYHQTNKSCILRVLFLFAFHLWSKIDANIICCVTDNLAWMVWSLWGVGGQMSENEMAPWSEGCGVPRLPYDAPKKNGLTFCPLTLTKAAAKLKRVQPTQFDDNNGEIANPDDACWQQLYALPEYTRFEWKENGIK